MFRFRSAPCAGAPALLVGVGLRGAATRALLTFVVLIAATVWMWREASQEGTRLSQARFAFQVKEAKFTVQQRLAAYEQVLRGGVGLFSAVPEVGRDAWRHYVSALEIGKNYPGIQGIGYALRVPAVELEAHTRAVRAEGFQAYAVRPAGQRDEYTSIIYLEPFDWRNQRAFGFDMFSEPVRRAAMILARDSGLPSVSGKVTLVQETSKDVQSGFLMYLPVYRGDGPAPTTPEQRRAALRGYVYAPFRMNDLMDSALTRAVRDGIHLQVFDGEAGSAEALLYDSGAGSHDPRPGPPTFSSDERFEFNGRVWTMRFGSTPGFDGAIDPQKPQLILFGGLLISVLFSMVVWWSAINRHRARQIAVANRELREEIDTRTRLAVQLEEAKNLAEGANRAKGEFLANVSHELRTPLTLMLAPLEDLLLHDAAPSDWRAQTERVRRNALLLLNRVNDILDYSKAEAGKFELRCQRIEPAALVALLLEDAATVATRKGCTLAWSIDSALGAICTDPSHFEKILLNLVSNALKFTSSGGHIAVEMRALDAEWFVLEVTDSGCGIEESELPRLFERFHQVDGSALRQHGGTGIGLALVKEMTELMGGNVSVASRPGEGSSFFVRLRRVMPIVDERQQAGPVADADSAPHLPDALREVRFDESAPPAGGRVPLEAPGTAAARVLIADDHPEMRSYVARLLGGEHAVVTVEDGEQAWAALNSQPFDAVVTDVMMPRLDGLSLTARMKADPRLARIPVILLTARGGDEARAAGLEGGADDYLAKPFSSQELKARVHAALRMSRAHAELREQSHQAGMAMQATGLLHDLGNVLNGVTVSSGILREKLTGSKLGSLHRVADLVEAALLRVPGSPRHEGDATLPAYVRHLARRLQDEHAGLLKEAECIRDCADHAAAVIAAQQGLAKGRRVFDELVRVNTVMDSAAEMSLSAFGLQGVALHRDYGCDASVMADRHKILQILLNLLANASHALNAVPANERAIRLRTSLDSGRVRLEVQDNGTGIDQQFMPLLFNQRFTTKPLGHGSGLHSSANWAREMGGLLTGHSNGPGQGATFVLEMPAHVAVAPESSDAAARNVANTGCLTS